ncbi:MAG: response regulator transcription factor [Proteobacteria bacterium]|nr:response regulator transcription factor [Pseudomonadota bacterium]
MDQNRVHVLLVEDDQRIAELTCKHLTRHDIQVAWVSDGARGLREGKSGHYDIVVLDILLPNSNGIAVCRQLRAFSDIPIILLTALGDEPDRILGLETGADDYLTKPFSGRELVARIRTIMRRVRGQQGPARKAVTHGPLRLDPASLRATLDGRDLELTAYEFELLKALVERAGQVVSRNTLLEVAKGNAEEAFDRSIDVRISRLRQKLADDPRKPRLLKTVRGAGYMLVNDIWQ